MIHRVEMVFPGLVEPAQNQAALHAAHLRAVTSVEDIPQSLPRRLFTDAGQFGFRHLQTERRSKPLRHLLGVIRLGDISALKYFLELVVDILMADFGKVAAADFQQDLVKLGA